MSQIDLDFLQKHINRYEVRLNKYHLRDITQANQINDEEPDKIREQFPCYQNVPNYVEAKLCTWDFMDETEVQELLACENVQNIRKLLDDKLCGNYPKAGQRIITVDLLYSTLKYAANTKLSVLQTACLLSIFYLTHRNFTMSYTSTAEDVFHCFKDYLLHHSIEFVPDYNEIFDANEAYNIFHYFCKLYLRHLPIIRLLSLPNFEFELNLTVEPMPVFKKKKKGKDKKGKKKGKGDKGKKKKKK